MTVLWNPEPFNAQIRQAFVDAARMTTQAIAATKPQHEIPVRGPFVMDGGRRAVIRTGGLAPIFEKGARPHEIFPKGTATFRRSKSKGQVVFKFRSIRGHTSTVLRLADGRFAAHVSHPGMEARPFIRPQVALFQPRFRRIAKVRLAVYSARAAA